MEKNIFFTALYGSQNYHLETGLSDIDTKTLVIPSFKNLVNGKILSTTVETKDGLDDRKDLRKMFEQFLKQNPSYLEILASREVEVNPLYQEEYNELISMTDEIVHYNPKALFWATFGTILQKQKSMLEVKPTTKDNIEKYGYDGKNASHILRLNNLYTSLKQGRNLKNSLDARHYPDYNTILALKLHMVKKEKAIEYTQEAITKIEKFKEDEFKELDKEVELKLKDLAFRIIKKATISELNS